MALNYSINNQPLNDILAITLLIIIIIIPTTKQEISLIKPSAVITHCMILIWLVGKNLRLIILFIMGKAFKSSLSVKILIL